MKGEECVRERKIESVKDRKTVINIDKQTDRIRKSLIKQLKRHSPNKILNTLSFNETTVSLNPFLPKPSVGKR